MSWFEVSVRDIRLWEILLSALSQSRSRGWRRTNTLLFSTENKNCLRQFGEENDRKLLRWSGQQHDDSVSNGPTK